MWRDFEVATKPGVDTSTVSLTISYKREYWARDCKLRLTMDNTSCTIDLEDFAPRSTRVLQAPVITDSFHREISYTTHQGLTMLATGAYARSLEEKDFLELLKGRDTYSFLSKLLNAEVVTAEGQKAPPTLTEMQRSDSVVPVAFRKPDGTVYITCFARRPVRDGLYVKAEIPTAFKGVATAVDEWTGETTATTAKWEDRPQGILFRNVDVPCIPGAIGERSDEPLSVPVFRIAPE